MANWTDLVLGPGSTSERPAAVDVPDGTLYMNSETSVLERTVSGVWTDYLTLPTSGSGGGSDVPSGAEDFSTGYSWVNQGSASVVVTDAAAAMTCPSGSRFSWALLVKAASGGDVTITWKSKLLANPFSPFVFFGAVIRNSSSGKFISWGFGFNASGPAWWGYYWASTASNGGDITTVIPMNGLLYFRLRIASGIIHFEGSPDGINWIASSSTQAVATNLGSYDQIGFGGHNDSGYPSLGVIEWMTIE